MSAASVKSSHPVQLVERFQRAFEVGEQSGRFVRRLCGDGAEKRGDACHVPGRSVLAAQIFEDLVLEVLYTHGGSGDAARAARSAEEDVILRERGPFPEQ